MMAQNLAAAPFPSAAPRPPGVPASRVTLPPAAAGTLSSPPSAGRRSGPPPAQPNITAANPIKAMYFPARFIR